MWRLTLARGVLFLLSAETDLNFYACQRIRFLNVETFYACQRLRFLDVDTNLCPRCPVPVVCRVNLSDLTVASSQYDILLCS